MTINGPCTISFGGETYTIPAGEVYQVVDPHYFPAAEDLRAIKELYPNTKTESEP